MKSVVEDLLLIGIGALLGLILASRIHKQPQEAEADPEFEWSDHTDYNREPDVLGGIQGQIDGLHLWSQEVDRRLEALEER